MDISRIDSNFALPGSVKKDGLVWLNASQKPFAVYGAAQCDPYLRMPLEIARAISSGVEGLCQNTAGIRVRFRTNSPYIAIRAEWNHQCHMAHMPFLGISGFDLYRVSDVTHKQTYVKSFVPPVSCEHGYESVIDVEGKMTDYVLNFPLYNKVSRLLIGVKQGSGFDSPLRYSNSDPIVFYGSSITQGGCASRPGNCYQNFLSRALDLDYVNLGFSGSGRAEDAMIAYLADLKMSAFVSDYDYNAPSADYLEMTHEKLYRGIRQKNPTVPYIIISRPNFGNNTQDEQRRSVIMRTYQKAVFDGDTNVYYLDGASIFAGDERDACTVDGCHPNDLGFYRFFKALLPIFERISSCEG